MTKVSCRASPLGSSRALTWYGSCRHFRSWVAFFRRRASCTPMAPPTSSSGSGTCASACLASCSHAPVLKHPLQFRPIPPELELDVRRLRQIARSLASFADDLPCPPPTVIKPNAPLKSWSILNFDRGIAEHDIQEFVRTLVQAGSAAGLSSRATSADGMGAFLLMAPLDPFDRNDLC